MLHRPKKRTCPSLKRMTWLNTRRQPEGDRNGKRPSITRTRAMASQKVSPSTRYFLTAAGAWPRNTLKNSELLGSSTITSLFLLKLAL